MQNMMSFGKQADRSVRNKRICMFEQVRQIVFGKDRCNTRRLGFLFQDTACMQREQNDRNTGKELSIACFWWRFSRHLPSCP